MSQSVRAMDAYLREQVSQMENMRMNSQAQDSAECGSYGCGIVDFVRVSGRDVD